MDESISHPERHAPRPYRRPRRQVSRDRRQFERLVRRALDELPDDILAALKNIAVVIEDEPTPDQLERLGLGPGDRLYGLYEGIPLTQRDSGYSGVLPDKISIFQKSITGDYPSFGEMKRFVKEVVRHEVAHYFGYTDEDLAT